MAAGYPSVSATDNQSGERDATQQQLDRYRAELQILDERTRIIERSREAEEDA
jgi:hypothetical protein